MPNNNLNLPPFAPCKSFSISIDTTRQTQIQFAPLAYLLNAHRTARTARGSRQISPDQELAQNKNPHSGRPAHEPMGSTAHDRISIADRIEDVPYPRAKGHAQPTLGRDTLVKLLDQGQSLAKDIHRINRNKVIHWFAHTPFRIPINLDNIVYIWNEIGPKNSLVRKDAPQLILQAVADMQPISKY